MRSMRDSLKDDDEAPYIFVEAKNGDYIPIEELLKPFDGILHIGAHANYVDASNAAKVFGSDDPDLVCTILGQIGALRRGNEKLGQWHLRFVVSFVRDNRPTTGAQMSMAVHLALVHLQIMEAFNRMERAFTESEYEMASRAQTRLVRLFAQVTVVFETLARRKVINDAQLVLPSEEQTPPHPSGVAAEPQPVQVDHGDERPVLRVMK